jgi:hypothetical protein
VASRTVRARLDEASEAALRLLIQEGHNESEAVRLALIEAGRRRRRRTELAAEVLEAARDAEDRRVQAEVLADMEPASPPWPDG